ncbi:MAG: 50S ribosomal protein L9 [Thermaerobacter sp.]|nr:50S ribosomal protein L9 [Thermaerobacter sp.]MDA8144638.1 50S ribosomal protein L9 [Thermaerobacter sp.]
MKVILRQDVARLGHQGEAVEVAEGYARNFLLPRGMAVEASAANLRVLAQTAERERRRQERELDEARTAAERVGGMHLRFRVRCGEDGKVFGAVTSKDVAQALERELGTAVDKRRVELAEPLRALGTREVLVRFHAAAPARVMVELVPE